MTEPVAGIRDQHVDRPAAASPHTARRRPSGWPGRRGRASARTPSARNVAAALSISGWSAATRRSKPRSAHSFASSKPMPEEAPVTMANCRLGSMVVVSLTAPGSTSMPPACRSRARQRRAESLTRAHTHLQTDRDLPRLRVRPSSGYAARKQLGLRLVVRVAADVHSMTKGQADPRTSVRDLRHRVLPVPVDARPPATRRSPRPSENADDEPPPRGRSRNRRRSPRDTSAMIGSSISLRM